MLDTFLKPRFLQDVGANAQGMGLGLAVVLEIVQMHQGSVHLESGEPSFFSPKKTHASRKRPKRWCLRSQVGKGSSFTISLSCLDDEFCHLENLGKKRFSGLLVFFLCFFGEQNLQDD